MPTMRFNHMELTLAPGTLDQTLRADITAFYGEIFGWTAMNVHIVDQDALLLMVDPEVSQFILVAESPKPMASPGYDHLGLLLETRAEVDALRARVGEWQQRDPRVRIKDYDDLVQGPVTVHAFYVKHLLPIWFDVQTIEYEAAAAPKRAWHFA
jgi:hypothetical protein